MLKQHVLALIVWSAMLAATGAVADVQNPVDSANRSAATRGDAEDAAIRRVLTEFRTIHIPLSRAMAIAERLHDGSKTADISFESAGSPVYRVRTMRKERVWENTIDANTGSVAGREVTCSLRELGREELANMIALKWIKQELSDAVQVAERATAGNALAGGLVRQDGKPTFVVVVAAGDDLKEVMLEPPKVAKQGPIHR
ncbi:PepSY domain-containing protein [Bradyrhizobium sp. INPA01-394B]|uniref:PepSY domain-containing protein n=1 Tax=Bradyrhizobium campsiandrae TaxID=1729892 RepID=A0ABR7U256_9BRAD|nr:PepSY domain-containing protein [Bradyrhizobium campsiandrae]MBC9883093.1 PepSY domain-containing protein [Bradyrhizobium campsiandrae]MBC9978055.1 PepSY domain-containing protein [Bradyrhizobium campsiandrae]